MMIQEQRKYIADTENKNLNDLKLIPTDSLKSVMVDTVIERKKNV